MTEQTQILVIDQEPEWRTFLTKTLEDAGYHVISMAEAPPSLPETDMNGKALLLVDASQKELLRLLAQTYTDMRFLVFTAAPSPPEAIRAYRCGALGYEGKSFDPGHLIHLVTDALGRPPVQSLRFAN